MFIPLSCDAPVYHWPFATVGLIAVNVAMFFGVPAYVGDDPARAAAALEWLVLAHGDGIHPIQWFTSEFMHAGWGHLAGNMLFLWVFGLVVEGKLGWWRFLCVYLAITGIQSAAEQVVALGIEGPSYSLGASSAIYGLMAIALVWAPKNEIDCWYWFFFAFVGQVDVPIAMFVTLYLAFDVAGILLSYLSNDGLMSSGLLHIMGAAVGAPIGLVLLTRGIVDCEGWDILSLWKGHGSPAHKDDRQANARLEQQKLERDAELLTAAKTQLAAYLSQKNARAAKALYDKMRDVAGGIDLDRQQLLEMIAGLHREKQWADSAPLMAQLIDRYPDGSDPVRIKLAHICVAELERPARALELLAKVDFSKQPPETTALAKKIVARARQMQAGAEYELDNDAW